jgi:hypothetical protein
LKIRLRHDVTGTFHGISGGVQRGQVVEVDDANGRRYIAAGLAESAAPKKDEVEEHAVVESAVVESAVVKRGRGRPRRQPSEWADEGAPGWKDASPQ